MLKQLFVSYRHESPEHARAVRRLCEQLRQAKIPIAFDQFHLDAEPGGPNDGWPKWCEDSASKSACALIIASEGWFAAYDKAAPAGEGLGAAAEADIFRQKFWDEAGHNSRIRVAFLNPLAADKVPDRLRTWHQFRPFQSEGEFTGLIRWAAGCLDLTDIDPSAVRWPEPLAQFRPDLANRTKNEWPAIVRLLAGQAQKRILFFQGESGLGKSELVRQAERYARQLSIPVVRIDFKGGALDLSDILGQFQLDLSQFLPSFCAEGGTKTHLLRMDLRRLRQPVLVIFDSYEACSGNGTIADWLNQKFLTEVETSRALSVIVAGQKVPEFALSGWRDLVDHLPLRPIVDAADWNAWIEKHWPECLKKGDLTTMLKLAQGNPMLVAQFCETLSKY